MGDQGMMVIKDPTDRVVRCLRLRDEIFYKKNYVI